MTDALDPNTAYDVLRDLSSGSNVPASVCSQLASYVENLECEVQRLRDEVEALRKGSAA